MLELKPGARVLDIACGAGRFARRMAGRGANVVAIDHSAKFIRRARQRMKGSKDNIEYRVMNAAYSRHYVHMRIGIPGQPEPHYYFHRPINMLLNTCFKYGFVLDSIEEPALPEGSESRSDRPLAWSNFHTIPHSLVARMRLLPATATK